MTKTTNRIISLKCPACRGNLSGENNSKVFFCFPCNKSFSVGDEQLHMYPFSVAQPRTVKPGEAVHFPFWRFETQYTADVSDPDKGYMNTRMFYVPAFFIKNVNYFGDIGFFYLKNNVVLEPGPPQKSLTVFPADRDVNRAAQYPYIYLCKELTAGGRAQLPELKMKHLSASVMLVPFYKADGHFHDSILDWKYPTGALI